jgi:hypothetical protein
MVHLLNAVKFESIGEPIVARNKVGYALAALVISLTAVQPRARRFGRRRGTFRQAPMIAVRTVRFPANPGLTSDSAPGQL